MMVLWHTQCLREKRLRWLFLQTQTEAKKQGGGVCLCAYNNSLEDCTAMETILILALLAWLNLLLGEGRGKREEQTGQGLGWP